MVNKLKKLVLFPLCAAAVLGAAVGCGEDLTNKVVIWATAKEQSVIESVVEEYNKTAADEDKIQIKFTAVAEGDTGAEIVKDPTAATSADLFLVADDHISNLVEKGIALEVTGTRKEAVIKDNTPVAVSGATLNDKLYGFPITSDNGYFLWYNKGVTGIDTAVSSLEDLLALAKKNGKKVLMDVANGWYANSFIMSPDACGVESLYWSTDADGKSSYTTTWDNETGVKVSEYIGGLLKGYYDDGTLITGGNEQIIAGFTDSSLIAAVSGTWMEEDIKVTAGVGDNTAATILPKYSIDGKSYQMASFIGSKVYCINKTKTTDKQKKAVKLAELLTTKEAQLKRFEKRSTLPCNNEAIADARYTEHSTIGGAALTAQATAAGVVQSKTAENRYWDIGKAIGQAYLDGKLGTQTDNTPNTWTTFLKGQMDTLRAKQ